MRSLEFKISFDFAKFSQNGMGFWKKSTYIMHMSADNIDSIYIIPNPCVLLTALTVYTISKSFCCVDLLQLFCQRLRQKGI